MKQTDKQDKIQRENRNKLPVFLLLVVLGGVFGACIAIFSSWLGSVVSPEEVAWSATLALGAAAPFLTLLCLPFLLAAQWCLRKSQTLFEHWDGDDERLPEQIEQRLNWALLWVGTIQFLVFLSLGLCLSLLPLKALSYGVASAMLLFSMVMLFFCIRLQRRTVDLSRQMNPEKQGSVYDMRFRKKWYDSCDEAERRLIGEAAYASYTATSYTSLFLWVVMAMLNIFLPVGPLPVLVALIPWGAGQLAYLVHCIRASKQTSAPQ